MDELKVERSDFISIDFNLKVWASFESIIVNFKHFETLLNGIFKDNVTDNIYVNESMVNFFQIWKSGIFWH
jgi:hypothetical protein